jgi:hypothetical protein
MFLTSCTLKLLLLDASSYGLFYGQGQKGKKTTVPD